MAGWWDSLFGSSTPQPAHPASRGALLGAAFQGMPSSSNVEDRRTVGSYSYLPSRPHDRNFASTNPFSPFDPNTFDAEREAFHARQWANSHMPQTLPTRPMVDPSQAPDSSIMARIKAWQSQGQDENEPMGMTLNSVPQGWQ